MRTVFGADEQSEVEVDVLRWVRLARMVLDQERVPEESEMSVIFVDEQAMSDLHERFLGGSGPTDVLAFPMDDDVAPGGRQPDQGGRAMAETAFTRMGRVRALALEEEGRGGATRLARLLERPERTLNSLLLVILVCQLVSANLTGVLLEEHLGTIGFVLGIVVEIAVFFEM